MDVYLTELVRYLAAQSGFIAVLTLLMVVVTWALRHRTAHIRYLLWLLILAKCFVPPYFAVPLKVLPEPAEVSAVETPAIQTIRTAPPAAAPIEPPGAPSLSGAIVPDLTVPPNGSSKPTPNLAARVGILWLVGVGLYLSLNLLRAIRGGYWLRKNRRPLPAEYRQEIEPLIGAEAPTSLPTIWIVDGIGQPFVWGLLRGSIYIPPSFLRLQDAVRRRYVLAHELAHVQRCDPAVNLLQIVAQGLFWFHPCVWWANRQIRREREKCCDEMAVAVLGAQARDYCHAVVETLAGAETPSRPVPSLAVAGPAKNLEERIQAMLRPNKRFYRHPSRTATASIRLVALLTVSVTFAVTGKTETEETAPPQKDLVSKAKPNEVLPPGWSLEYDDGITADGKSRIWNGQMAQDLASLRVLPRPTDPQDTTWKSENCEFAFVSSAGESVGTINIHRDFHDRQTWQMILKPDRYTMRYKRAGGKNPDNFWMYGGPFIVDLRKPGMYTLRFRPKLGEAQITGSLAGCYALNFENIETGGLPINGTIYQYPPKQYTIDGIPAGRYRLSAVTQADGPNVFVSQAEAIVPADGTVTIDMPAPPQGTCSLKGTLMGRPRQYKTPWEVEPHYSNGKWYVLLRDPGAEPIEQTTTYEAKTMDSRYVIRATKIVQETEDTATYSISGIAPGQYTVTAIEHPSFGGCTIERQLSKPLTLKAGEEATLDFDLTIAANTQAARAN